MNPAEAQIDVAILGGPVAVREALKRRLNDESTTNVIEYEATAVRSLHCRRSPQTS